MWCPFCRTTPSTSWSMWFLTAVLTNAVAPSTTRPLEEDLETLAYRYGTDKSHDDHKYSDLCISICGASNLD